MGCCRSDRLNEHSQPKRPNSRRVLHGQRQRPGRAGQSVNRLHNCHTSPSAIPTRYHSCRVSLNCSPLLYQQAAYCSHCSHRTTQPRPRCCCRNTRSLNTLLFRLSPRIPTPFRSADVSRLRSSRTLYCRPNPGTRVSTFLFCCLFFRGIVAQLEFGFHVN
jgi:hypothetical protein